MKERTFTNQETIEVMLSDKEGVDTLDFTFPKSEEVISVNLNETSGQKDLKRVFEELLKRLNLADVRLELTIDNEYKKGLYKEVCSEYITDLNKEIQQIRADILKL